MCDHNMHLLTLSNGINNPYFCYQQNRIVIISAIITCYSICFFCVHVPIVYICCRLQSGREVRQHQLHDQEDQGSLERRPAGSVIPLPRQLRRGEVPGAFLRSGVIPYLTLEFLKLNCKNLILTQRVFPGTPLVDTLMVTPLPFGYERCNIAPTEIRHREALESSVRSRQVVRSMQNWTKREYQR